MELKKTIGTTLALLLVISGVTAGFLRDTSRYDLFGDSGGMGDSRNIMTPNGERKVWLLAQNDEWVYFNGRMINDWPDSTTQYMVQSGSQTQTNTPAAATELTGNYRVIGDFTDKQEFRFGTTLAVQSSTNARMYLQYSLTGANWFNVSRNDQSISLSGTTPITRVTEWEEVPPGMKVGNTILRVVTVGGDGVADPQYRGVWIEAR
jgi:hypothetical protein